MKKGWLVFTELDPASLAREPDPQVREIILQRHRAITDRACRHGRVLHHGTRGSVRVYDDPIQAVEDAIRIHHMHRSQGDLPPLPPLKVLVLHTDYDDAGDVVVGDLVPVAFQALRDAGGGELLVCPDTVRHWEMEGSRELTGIKRKITLGSTTLQLQLLAWSSPRREPRVKAYERGRSMSVLMLIPGLLIILIVGSWGMTARFKAGSAGEQAALFLPDEIKPLLKETLRGSVFMEARWEWHGDECTGPDGDRKLCLVLLDTDTGRIAGIWRLGWDRNEWVRFLGGLRDSSRIPESDSSVLCSGYTGLLRDRCAEDYSREFSHM